MKGKLKEYFFWILIDKFIKSLLEDGEWERMNDFDLVFLIIVEFKDRFNFCRWEKYIVKKRYE